MITTGRPISRIEVARTTALTKQTISNLTEELVQAGLVQEVGLRRTGVGKPSRMLDLNPNGLFTVGLRVANGKIDAGIYNIAGEEILARSGDMILSEPNQVAARLCKICDQLITDSGIERSRLLAIGLLLPHTKRLMQHSPNATPSSAKLSLEWQEMIIRALHESQKLPVTTGNAAAAVAASELLYGAARELDSFTYVHLGHVIEASFVFDRLLMRGANGISGQLGHLQVEPDGRPCLCGNTGCLNQYAALGALEAFFSKTGAGPIDWHSLKDDNKKARKALDQWLDDMSEPMRAGLNALENLFNAQTIILGGDAPDWFLDSFVRKLRPFMPSVSQYGPRSLPRLIRAPSIKNRAIRGAAALPFHVALSPDTIASTDETRDNELPTPTSRLLEIIGHIRSQTQVS